MAITTSADFQLRELYTSYIMEAFTEDVNLVSSGIVSSNPQISGLTSSEGHAGTVRYYGNAAPTVNVQDESATAATPDSINTGVMQAIKFARSTTWSVGDLGMVLSNENGIVESARQAVRAQLVNEQKNLVDMAFGILEDNSDNDSGDAISVIAKQGAGASDATNLISRDAIIDLVTQLEGDPSDFIMCMNYKTWGSLAKLDGTSLIRTSDNPMFVGSFMGIPVMVNNQILDISAAGGSFVNGAASAHFDTSKLQGVVYFFRKSSFAYGSIAMPTPVGVERDELAGYGSGTTTVAYRWGHILHPLGYDWSGVTNAYATDALVKVAASWDRKWNNIKTQAVSALVFNH